MTNLFISLILIVSIGLNSYQFAIRKKPKKQLDESAKDLLRHIMSGRAVVSISVIDPETVLFYRNGR